MILEKTNSIHKWIQHQIWLETLSNHQHTPILHPILGKEWLFVALIAWLNFIFGTNTFNKRILTQYASENWKRIFFKIIEIDGKIVESFEKGFQSHCQIWFTIATNSSQHRGQWKSGNMINVYLEKIGGTIHDGMLLHPWGLSWDTKHCNLEY